MSQLLDDLIATRQALQERGRCGVSLMKHDGSLCLDGAIGVATIEGFTDLVEARERDAYNELISDPRAQAVTRVIADLVQDVEVHKCYHNGWMSATDGSSPFKTVGAQAEGDPVRACWIYNDWTDVSDDEVFAMLDKAILNAGGSL